MRVGDVIFFAPEVPFEAVDLSGETLPEQILARVDGYYLDAADYCIRARFAFAAGVLIVTCIDAVSEFDRGPKSRQNFLTFVRARLPTFKEERNASLLYEEYRNGLVHEGRLKKGCQFALGLGRTLDTTGAYPVIDAGGLLNEVRGAIHQLVKEMQGSKPFREQLVRYVRRKFAYEFNAARRK